MDADPLEAAAPAAKAKPDGIDTRFKPGNPQRFLPGRSGNPDGRPAGVVHYIQKKCGHDYRKLVDALYVMALGTADERRQMFGEAVTVSARDRRECVSELFDRAVGRPRTPDADELETRREIIIRIPRPAAELEGRTVVYDVERLPEAP